MPPAGIDTAWHYQSEGPIAKGVQASGVARKDLFLLTKTETFGDDAVEQAKQSLARLQTSFVDVLMMSVAPFCPGAGLSCRVL